MPLTTGDRVEVYDPHAGRRVCGRLESETDEWYMVLLDTAVFHDGRLTNHLHVWKSGSPSILKRPDSDPRIERLAEVLYDLVGAEREFEWRSKYGVPETVEGVRIGICQLPFGESDRRPFYLAAAEKILAILGTTP
jgi:hypothetical protein